MNNNTSPKTGREFFFSFPFLPRLKISTVKHCIFDTYGVIYEILLWVFRKFYCGSFVHYREQRRLWIPDMQPKFFLAHTKLTMVLTVKIAVFWIRDILVRIWIQLFPSVTFKM